MTLAEQYAKALWSAVRDNPDRGSEYLGNVREILKRRGHEQLLPHIFRAYEHLEIQRGRKSLRAALTPEERRTRTLVELYRKLISA